ncbi:MAG: NADH-quinone oxidoreductase subunit J, partial [Actinomycetota bacterium]|nr:NADH-quinone oxidoreductase subunit J [Actinomycetota bacterium]
MNDIISYVIFFALAILAVSSAVLVVTGRNLFHAAMFLGLYLLSIAGYYFLLKADLVGMMQVFVYVGGVVVVLLFGIMLTAQLTNVRLTSAME